METIERTLSIDAKELYFSAAHYIPNHPQCGKLHGHTYFVKNLRIVAKGLVDFGDLKKAIKTFDHCTLVPKKHADEWDKIYTRLVVEKSPIADVFSNIIPIRDTDLPGTTVERIAEALREEFHRIPGVVEVHFTLTEGPTAGRQV